MIRNILEEGESIVIDRYAFSGVAFSAAKVANAKVNSEKQL